MKIAYLLGSINRGGTETLMLDCFKQSKEAGFEMIGICRKQGQLFNEFRKTEVPLFQLNPKGRFDLIYIIKLRKLLKLNKIDVVHAQQPVDALYGYLASIGINMKVVLTFHGFDFNSSLLSSLITRFIIKRSDLNIFVSKVQREYYQRKYNLASSQKLRVIPNGISFKKFDITGSFSLKTELNIPGKNILLGTVGNFVAGRDPIVICRFLNLLKKEGAAFSFLFIGAEDKEESWRYLECVNYCRENDLSGNVYFLGSRDDVPSILKQLDAFVYSTVHDTFSISVIEAMASGIPVFINDWDVMKEITGNGGYAIFYETKNEADLLAKFISFKANKDLYVNQAKESAQWVRKKYPISGHLFELKQTYSNLISKDNPNLNRILDAV